MGTAIEANPETGVGTWPGRAAHAAEGWLPADARRWLRENAPGRLEDWLEGGSPDESGEVDPGVSQSGVVAAPAHARDLALAPGMPVEVYLRTGERSPLSYFAKPLTDYFAGSLKEE